MNYAKIARFLSVAKISPSYPEFMMEVVFRGKADVGTKEFFIAHIEPLICSDGIDDSVSYVDHFAVKRKFRKEMLALPWLSAYLDAMLPNSKPRDVVAAFHC